MPSASHHQQAAEEGDVLASAFAGMGFHSSSHLPRSLFQVDPLHLTKHLAFFKRMGICAEGFSKIVSRYPQALSLDPDTEIKVSISLLESALGKNLVGECILSWPSLLCIGSLQKELGLGLESAQQQGPGLTSRALGCLRQAGESEFSDKELGYPQQEAAMYKLGVPQQVFESKVDFLLKCGFKKNSKLLAKALQCTLCVSKQDMDAVMHALMSLDLSCSYAGKLIKLQPPILQQKPSEITPKLDYLLNKLCLSCEDLLKHSSYMLYSLNSHIRPRILMHSWLKSKRLLRRNFKLDYVLSLSEKQFICKFVECHEDGLSMYNGFMRNAK